MKKAASLLILSFSIFSLSLLTNSSPFLIQERPKKRVSKNKLKQKIGDQLKSALYKCVSISHKLGLVQQKLALLQKRIVSRVDGLISNERIFRKAGRSDLSGALSIMDKTSAELTDQERRVSRLIAQLQTNKCLKGEPRA